ncbi:hypothetical protein HNQ80_004147 [Anaerosolibacter carboniphilus]|uniref:Uncharacterized protein n=1 Tax=Anaerosolibacter carboniphilus TaxID=1417629 RepID=A0A841L1G6_9FIRM|nr:hypothetical protein [Anaerosolibacter carboniphilus]MBB6218010.1 hypothetical protein [Anaerosolibacter carboniphilus]
MTEDMKDEKEKVYTASKEHIKKAVFKSLAIAAAYSVFMLLIGRSTFTFLSIFVGIILGAIFLFTVNAISKNKVFVANEYIAFKPIYTNEMDTYNWHRVTSVAIGNVEDNRGRVPVTIYGVQMVYFRDTLDDEKVATSIAFALDHFVDYDLLIDDIKQICITRGISVQDGR